MCDLLHTTASVPPQKICFRTGYYRQNARSRCACDNLAHYVHFSFRIQNTTEGVPRPVLSKAIYDNVTHDSNTFPDHSLNFWRYL